MTEGDGKGKRISLKPLDFEEALKGLLDTEPPPKEKASPKERQPRPTRRKRETPAP